MRDAGYAVPVGFLLGDIVDGTVPRLTQTAIRGGADFDSIVDHFVHVCMPGFVVFTVHQLGGHTARGLLNVAPRA